MAQFTRHTAFKTNIQDIQKSRMIPGTDEEPGAIVIKNIVARKVHLVATCIQTTENEAVIDDSTGCIRLRMFEKYGLEIGKTYRIIARMREFNEEKYLVPEIAKKLKDIRWAEVHRIETKTTDVCSIVDGLDDGNGALFEDIALKLGSDSQIINELSKGTIFEVSPGRIKVLR